MEFGKRHNTTDTTYFCSCQLVTVLLRGNWCNGFCLKPAGNPTKLLTVLLLQDFVSNLVYQVFRAYTFDANDNSFRLLMLQSDWTRFQAQMIWTLWNPFTVNNVMFMSAFASPFETPVNSCLASGWSIVKTYPSTATLEEAISVRQQQVDDEVGHYVIMLPCTAGHAL